MPRIPKGESDLAPHGRDEHGVPLAPHGLNTNGTPRKSKRGRAPGQGFPGKTPISVKSNLTDIERKGMLTDLTDMFLVAPLASASQAPIAQKRLGPAQADALAGHAFIISHFAPNIFDGLILLSKTKPKVLSWMDKAEENAPYLVLTQAVMQMGKALVDNVMRPSRELAEAGRNLARLKMEAMAAAVNAQAEQIKASAPPPPPAWADEPTSEFAAA